MKWFGRGKKEETEEILVPTQENEIAENIETPAEKPKKSFFAKDRKSVV